mgnify:FL=1
MKGILINPIDETITEIEHKGSITDTIDARMMECVCIEKEDDIWIDEEGLLKQSNYFYKYKDMLLCGKSLVLGVTEDGDSTNCNHTLEELKKDITFKGKQHIDESRLGFTIVPLQ